MVAGIGCRSGVTAAQVEAAIEAAIEAVRALEVCTLTAIATPAAKAHEPGITAAAASRGIPLMLISQSALEAASPATLTRSEHSMAAMNVRSVAEAAALAGAAALADRAAPANTTAVAGATALTNATTRPAGAAPPRLLGPRIAVGPVTCALADATAAAPPLVSADTSRAMARALTTAIPDNP